MTENQGMVKLPDLDKWTYSKITTSPKPLVKLPNPISEQFSQISSTTVDSKNKIGVSPSETDSPNSGGS